MKTLRLIVFPLTLAALSAPLYAGLRIVSEYTHLPDGKPVPQTLLVDADKMRIDMPETSVLFLTDGGRDRLVMLDKAKNQYREMDAQTAAQVAGQVQGAMAQMQEQMKNMPPEQRAMMEKMMKGRMPPGMGGAEAPKRAATTYTAKGGGTVNGFACTNYDGTRDGQKVSEVCAAQPSQLKVTSADMQVFERMRNLAQQMAGPFANMSGGVSQYTDPGFQGFPVRHVGFSGGQPAFKSEIKSVQRTSFGAADFSLGNATKMEMPAMPGPRRR